MQATITTLETASLKNTTGSRNAEYHCQLVRLGDGEYQVHYQYGRIGSSLRPGTKPAAPVSLDKARKVFEKLVAEKKSDGYTEDGAPDTPDLSSTDLPPDTSFQRPQLLNEITREDAMRLIHDPDWVMQEKQDGQRVLIEITPAVNKVSNKLAKARTAPAVVLVQLQALEAMDLFFSPKIQQIHVDGELIGYDYHIFDLLQLDGNDMRSMPYRDREATYQRLLGGNKAKEDGSSDCFKSLKPVKTFITTEEKLEAFQRIEAAKGEGVVFKLASAPYTEGRPNSGGTALKFKFRERSTCICLGVSEGKRSIRLGMLDAAGDVVEVGKVTVLPNFDVPAEGDLVEVEYLYKYEGMGGCLFQPVMKGVRDDVLRSECTLAQVKRIKAKEGSDE